MMDSSDVVSVRRRKSSHSVVSREEREARKLKRREQRDEDEEQLIHTSHTNDTQVKPPTSSSSSSSSSSSRDLLTQFTSDEITPRLKRTGTASQLNTSSSNKKKDKERDKEREKEKERDRDKDSSRTRSRDAIESLEFRPVSKSVSLVDSPCDSPERDAASSRNTHNNRERTQTKEKERDRERERASEHKSSGRDIISDPVVGRREGRSSTFRTARIDEADEHEQKDDSEEERETQREKERNARLAKIREARKAKDASKVDSISPTSSPLSPNSSSPPPAPSSSGEAANTNNAAPHASRPTHRSQGSFSMDLAQAQSYDLSARTRITSVAAQQKTLDLKKLNNALKHIPDEFFDTQNFNPFNHWNDSTDMLDEYRAYVERAISVIVDAYHKGFNTATSSFSHVLQTFNETQKIIKLLNDNMRESKRLLGSRNQNLNDYWFQNRMRSKVLEILEKIEYVMCIPQLLESYIHAKQYVHAVHMLQHTLAMLVSDDLRDIEGLLELREELLLKKNTLQTFLIEELHRIIYCKEHDKKNKQDHKFINLSKADTKSSPFSSTLYSSLSSNDKDLSLTSSASPSKSPLDSKHCPFSSSSLNTPSLSSDPTALSLSSLLALENSDAYLKAAEASTTQFLQILIEALDQMNYLPSVKTQVNKRVRNELQEIINRETELSKEKARYLIPRPVVSRASESGLSSEGSEILIELVEKVFQQFIVVLKNQKDMIEIIDKKIRNKNANDSSGKSDASRRSSIEVDTKFSLSGVWEVIQIQLQIMLMDYLQSDKNKKNNSNSAPQINNKKKNLDVLELTFSFEDATAPSVVKMSRGLTKAEKERLKQLEQSNSSAASAPSPNWIQPTPYNITAIYRPIVQFTDQAQAILSSASTASNDKIDSQLGMFMKVFIETSFLPRVEADVNIRLDEVLNDQSSFDAREFQKDSRLHSSFSTPVLTLPLNTPQYTPPLEHNLLFKCVLEISEVLKKMFSDMYLLPHSISEYLRLIEHITDRLSDKCKDRINELTKEGWAAARLADHKLAAVMEQDPLLATLRLGEIRSEDEIDEYFSYFNPLYAPFFDSTFPLPKSSLLLDARLLSQLSLMCESFEWLSDRIFHMTDPYKVRGRASGRRSSSITEFTTQTTQLPYRMASAIERKRCGNQQQFQAFIAGLSPLDQKRWSLSESCLQLSDRCLFILRLELHSHFLFYLSNFKTSSYWCASAPSEPESFILDLNKHIQLADDSISKYISTAKKRYIFGGSFQLLSNYWIQSLKYLQDKRMNKKGVTQIWRNCFALQQNLTNLDGNQLQIRAAGLSQLSATGNVLMMNALGGADLSAAQQASQEGQFDKVRQYYELLNCTEDELNLFQLENPTLFTAEEYAALLSIHTQTRPAIDLNAYPSPHAR